MITKAKAADATAAGAILLPKIQQDFSGTVYLFIDYRRPDNLSSSYDDLDRE